MLRVAIFTDTFVPEINGVAKTLEKLTSYLAKNQIEYRVFAPNSKAAVPAVPHIERFASLPFLLYPECRLALPNPIHMKQALEEFQPTLIHVATPLNLGLYGIRYGKKHQIPMVASYHTHFDQYLRYYNVPFLQQWLWKYMIWFHRPFHKLFVPSQSTKDSLIRKGVHHDIELWKRGVNHSIYTPAKRGTKVRETYQIQEKNILLYVGRIAPEKEMEMVLNTFNALPEHLKKDTHLLIVGDGPLLKAMLEKHKDQRITFTGFLEGEELANVYASSDLFLFPSSTETFGNVVLEAMASGLPVIGARAGGVQHLIKHNKNGLLCKEKNLDSFVSATACLLENQSLRSQYSEQAHQYALTLSWDEIFAKLIESYLNVIHNRNVFTA
jgi:glycosyltransferase involved in cell wall biosynthesis